MSNRLTAVSVFCALWAGSLPLFASQVWQTPSIKLDRDYPEELARIRVRVFPHKRDFPPHYRDKMMSRFRIESEVPCTIYDAQPQSELRAHTIITRAKAVDFDATRLRDTVWVDCGGPYRLIRKGAGLPSFTYSGPLQVKSIEWRGKQILQAVVYLSMQQYLKGVVPAEVMASWPMETLKSQAVAARTYAIFHMSYARKYSRHPDFDVDDTVVFQAYTGLNGEHERTNLAVEQTAGEIVMFGEEVIQAYYHADSGGMTASAAHAFRLRAPYCQAKEEPYSKDLLRSHWQVKLTIAEINQKLGELGFIHPDNSIVAIQQDEVRKSPSGRVKSVGVKLKDGTTINLEIAKWKRAIALNSSLFEIKIVDENAAQTVLFEGRGYGHGVGLNQVGAKVLAHHYGWTYDQILKFYYSGIKVCTLEEQVQGESSTEPCLGVSDS